jgi:hypothetical protein
MPIRSSDPIFCRRYGKSHQRNERLVSYGYRYDEIGQDSLKTFSLSELEAKCVMKSPFNYGGCLSVRKKWLLEINGYEQHDYFSTGFHANGLDVYTRFKSLGLDIQWNPALKLYHPWHPFSRVSAPQYKVQKKVINWRAKQLSYLAFEGIDPAKNTTPPDGQLFEIKEEPSPNLLKRGIRKLAALTRG